MNGTERRKVHKRTKKRIVGRNENVDDERVPK